MREEKYDQAHEVRGYVELHITFYRSISATDGPDERTRPYYLATSFTRVALW